MVRKKSEKIKKRKFNPIEEINYYQRRVNLLIPKSAIVRVIRETIFKLRPRSNLKIQLTAVQALHEAIELYLIKMFEDSNVIAYHAKRVTLFDKDIKLVRRLRGPMDTGNR